MYHRENWPKHVGIIMDGNGRWAQQHGHQRVWGHLKGARTARKVIEECSRQGISTLTLYAFSTENWFRPEKEVSFLMHLLRRHLLREVKTLMKNNIQFSVIGDLQRLPIETRNEVSRTIEKTKNNTGMNLVFALSYGSRQEITEACRQVAEACVNQRLKPEQISEELLGQFLQTSPKNDPDLIIRTSGESRLSNFMLWQAAYSEFLTSHTLWPDFSIHELHEAFENFSQRDRRYGRISSESSSNLEAGTLA